MRKEKRTTSKIGNTKRTKKYVHQPNEREREIEKDSRSSCIASRRIGKKAGSYYCRRCGRADLL